MTKVSKMGNLDVSKAKNNKNVLSNRNPTYEILPKIGDLSHLKPDKNYQYSSNCSDRKSKENKQKINKISVKKQIIANVATVDKSTNNAFTLNQSTNSAAILDKSSKNAVNKEMEVGNYRKTSVRYDPKSILSIERVRDPNQSIFWNTKSSKRRKTFMSMETREVVYNIKYRQSTLERLSYDPFKVYNFGEENSGLHCPGTTPQNFRLLRGTLMKTKMLFEDPQFPSEDKSVYFESNSRMQQVTITWKRPHELVKTPRLFINNISRFDIKQGRLGNCWLLAAIANLTLNSTLFFQVVPSDQAFDQMYAGIFHFRFWQNGRWIDVCIDDRLPTSNGKLLFLRSASKNEFWSAMLEKAYAKLHGSYEAIRGGILADSLVDLTGGIVETFQTKEAHPDLYQLIRNAYFRSGLVGCFIEASPLAQELVTNLGLVKGHAYSITKTLTVTVQLNGQDEEVDLIRIRNPWGDKIKWKGDWCDNSNNWKTVSPEQKVAANLKGLADGEFWMSFSDFLTEFAGVVICMINPQSISKHVLSKVWNINVLEGSWVNGLTAGGCRNFIDTFQMNPQFEILLNSPDRDDTEGKCTIIVGLLQKNRRRLRSLGMDDQQIGFVLYKIADPDIKKPLNTMFFKTNKIFAMSSVFGSYREVTTRFRLPLGTYCLIPSTFEPGREADFLVRIYSDSNLGLKENEYSVGIQADTKVTNVTTDTKLSTLFTHATELFEMNANECHTIDWRKLKIVIESFYKTLEYPVPAFENEIYRNFIALFDWFGNGKIGKTDLLTLCAEISKWTKIFKETANTKLLMNGMELREALLAGGINVNCDILNLLIMRYGEVDGHLDCAGFLICAIKLQCQINSFQSKDTETMNIYNYLDAMLTIG